MRITMIVMWGDGADVGDLDIHGNPMDDAGNDIYGNDWPVKKEE